MSINQNIPIYASDLIDQLLTEYPEQTVSPVSNPNLVMFKAGQRALVLGLKNRLERQKDRGISQAGPNSIQVTPEVEPSIS